MDKTRSKQVELYLFAVKCIIHGKLRILTGKTHPKKSRTLTKSMYICIWVVDTSKQLFIIGSYSSYTETKFPKKWSGWWHKSVFLRNFHFVFPILFVLTLAFYSAVSYENVDSIVVLATKNRYSSFLKKVPVFQKTSLEHKLIKRFKISSDCHTKRCRSLVRSTVSKILLTSF